MNDSSNFFRVEFKPRPAFFGDAPCRLLRFEPRPDAGVRGEAAPPEGVEGLGIFERRFIPLPDFLEGMILLDTPVEYRFGHLDISDIWTLLASRA